jgi:hypothetical protein
MNEKQSVSCLVRPGGFEKGCQTEKMWYSQLKLDRTRQAKGAFLDG